MTQNVDYHIIIMGGGIVGLSLANLLSNTPLKIAVLEHNGLTYPYDAAQYDSRVSAINRASEKLFHDLGLWETLSCMRVSPYKKMCITDDTAKKIISFDCADIAEPNLGYIIENQVMLAALRSRLSSCHNVSLIPHFQGKTLSLSKEQSYVEDVEGKKIRFQLMVGADGKSSWVRKKSQLPIKQKNYGHTALITHVRTEQPLQQTAYQTFSLKGPIAFLPLVDPHLCSIVWSTDPVYAKHLLQLPKEIFETTLAAAFKQTLGYTTQVAPLQTFPLHYQHAEHYFKESVVLVGDAAPVIHPLAGLGLNLGLRDAACLAKTILHSHKQGRDVG